MKVRKKYRVILSIIAVILIGYKIMDTKVKRDYENYINNASNYSEKIGISIPKDSTVLDYKDTPKGFNGDGEEFVLIQLSDKGQDILINNAKKSSKWSSLPLPEEIQPIIFGGKYEDVDYGEGIFELEENIPRNIKNGMYYFKDRYAENYPDEADTDIKSRYSYNFTIAILDMDENKLYIFEYDS